MIRTYAQFADNSEQKLVSRIKSYILITHYAHYKPTRIPIDRMCRNGLRILYLGQVI